MKRFSSAPAWLFFALPVFSFFGCTTSNTSVLVSNPLNQERKDELVVLKRTDIEQKTGKIPNGKFVSIAGENGKPLTVQFDDINGDKSWDEAVFLYSFAPKENAIFDLRVSDSNSSEGAVQRAHVRMRKKNADDTFGPIITEETMSKNQPTDFSKQPLPLYLTEGPSWENDKVAFRLYFDTRNGKDIYGKRIPGMVMDSVGEHVNNSYHVLSNWGMDILHVGQSLGAGAIALDIPLGNGKDSLVRVGGNDIAKTSYQELADGPVRALFRMTYGGWKINGQPVEVTDEMSIWGGQYFYQSKVTVKGAPAGTKLVAGIADFYDNIMHQFRDSSTAILYSFGPQSENKDILGMGLMVPAKDFAEFGKTPDTLSDITHTYTVAQHIQNDQPLTYRFYSGWEKTDERFADGTYFGSFLKEQARLFGHPLEISWTR